MTKQEEKLFEVNEQNRKFVFYRSNNNHLKTGVKPQARQDTWVIEYIDNLYTKWL